MIITIAFVCFVVGFSAAIAVVQVPGVLQTNVVKLLNALGLLHANSHRLLDCISDSGGKGLDIKNHDLKGADGGLLSKEQIESQFEPSSWQSLAYQDFKSVILSRENGVKTFPCIYATMGYRAGEHRYVFLKSDNPSEPQNIRRIAPALRRYLSEARSLGSNTSLVIVAAPSKSEKSVDEYNNTFWEMLRGLRMVDNRSWPRDIPESIESEKWMFCFDGQPVFPVMLTPAHSQRWSRHMSVPLIALQPKWVLDELLSTPEKRQTAVAKVRKLLENFDQVEISPDLTSYGEKGTSEARQLCLLDKNETAMCPYSNLDR